MVVNNNIRLRKMKIVADKAHHLNHDRFSQKRKAYVWNGSVAQQKCSVIDLELASKQLAQADPDKVELWSLSSFR